MAKPRVYVETTIPSFYHDARTAPEIVARRNWMREWCATAADQYELVTSTAVVDELLEGPAEHHAAWLGLISDLIVLDVTPAISEIV